jgi:hypothetical protein
MNDGKIIDLGGYFLNKVTQGSGLREREIVVSGTIVETVDGTDHLLLPISGISETIIRDPYNLHFIRVPRIWTPEEVREFWPDESSTQAKRVYEMVQAGIPFMPGVQPNVAMAGFTNFNNFKGGGCNLRYEKEGNTWKPIQDYGYGKTFGEQLEERLRNVAEESGITEIPSKSNIVTLPTDESIIASLPLPFDIQRVFTNNPVKARELMDLVVKLRAAIDYPGEFPIQPGQVMEEIVRYFNQDPQVLRNRLYAYNKILVGNQVRKTEQGYQLILT